MEKRKPSASGYYNIDEAWSKSIMYVIQVPNHNSKDPSTATTQFNTQPKRIEAK